MANRTHHDGNLQKDMADELKTHHFNKYIPFYITLMHIVIHTHTHTYTIISVVRLLFINRWARKFHSIYFFLYHFVRAKLSSFTTDKLS